MKWNISKVLAGLDVASIAATVILWVLVASDYGDAITTVWLYSHLVSIFFMLVYTAFSLCQLIKKKLDSKKLTFIIYISLKCNKMHFKRDIH